MTAEHGEIKFMTQTLGKIINNQIIELNEKHSFFFCDLRGSEIILNTDYLQIVGCIIDDLSLCIEQEKSDILLDINLNLDSDKEIVINEKYSDKSRISIHRPIINEELTSLFKKVFDVKNYHKGYDNELLLNYISQNKDFEVIPLLSTCFLYAGKSWEVKTQIITYLYEEDKFRNLQHPYRQEVLKRTYMLLFDEEYMCRDFAAQLVSQLHPKPEELQLNDRNYILSIQEKYLFEGLSMLDKRYFKEIDEDILLKGLESTDCETVINVIKIMDNIDISRFWNRLIMYIQNKEYERISSDYLYALYKILSVFRYSDYYEEDISFYKLLLNFEDEFIQEDALYLSYDAGFHDLDFIKSFIEENRNKKFVKRFLEFVEKI